ncbi:MAG: PIN domain-containing protein [Propionibacteriaceae bacterium]|nr:PIN domain-containing protein [Propionibacteriaceae bacterium]
MIVVADTGGIIEAIDDTAPRHDAFRAVLERPDLDVRITPLVMTEVHYLLSAAGAQDVAAAFLEDVTAGFYRVESPAVADLSNAASLIARYRTAMARRRPKPGGLDLADAVNVAVAARLETNIIIATDQDYRQLSPLSHHKYFLLWPDDLD